MSQVFKEAFRELEQQRLQADKALSARQDFLHKQLPEIKKIDEELAAIGLGLAKMVLRPGDDAADKDVLRRRGEELSRRRQALLYDNGYDDNFFEEVYNCPVCKDTGKTGAGHCRCLKQLVISKYSEMSNLSQILTVENFDSFDINYYSDVVDITTGISPRDNMVRVWTASLKFVENFDTNFENLLFYGPTGLGKTFLSNCIAKELLARGKTVLYATASHLFKYAEAHRFNRDDTNKAAAFLAKVPDVDLLIVDDLGTEFSSIVTKAEMFNFINTRLLNRKSTIISTNLGPSDFEEFYSDRITSRLFGEYTMLQFYGDDIRIAKKHGL